MLDDIVRQTSLILSQAADFATLDCPDVLRPLLARQLEGMQRTKGFRIHLGLHTFSALPEASRNSLALTIHRLAAVQLFHEASLIIDDIIDHTPTRRSQAALHMSPGNRVSASCVAGYLSAVALKLYNEVVPTAEMLSAIATAEAMQREDRYATRPIPLHRWAAIAKGDTGALFTLALLSPCAASPPQSLISLCESLTFLYHGLDDLSDFLQAGPFSDNHNADLIDRVPTLLDCFAPYSIINCSPAEQRKAVKESLAFLSSHLPHNPTPFSPLFDSLRMIHSTLNEKAAVF